MYRISVKTKTDSFIYESENLPEIIDDHLEIRKCIMITIATTTNAKGIDTEVELSTDEIPVVYCQTETLLFFSVEKIKENS